MQSDYYSPSDKVVVDGNIVYANDLNKINTCSRHCLLFT